MDYQTKIFNQKAYIDLHNKLSEQTTTGLIMGCFDLVHIGHIELFRYAKERVDKLIVALDSDIAIKLTKGNSRPINSQAHRAILLSELSSIDIVLLMENQNEFVSNEGKSYCDQLVQMIQPNYLVTASHDRFWKNKKKRVESSGGKLILFELQSNVSTSNLVEKIIRTTTFGA